ncbi:TlpA family protein disulfide reductase [Novipirellula herctigrandis]|uniref:TlpA family protein disulfide reductase n=1 Tax=Novipirellula herctigrandis TaxID=2527986 RepID=UPI003AF33D65
MAAAKLKLCDWILSFDTFVQHREKIKQRLEELKNGSDAESIMSVKEIEFFLPALPTDTEYQAWKSEANLLLAALSLEDPSFRIPVVRAARFPNSVRIDLDATAKLPTIAGLGRKRVRHRVGSLLEDFGGKLLDRTFWKLSEQRGKVVVLLFSFTSCAPCKYMDPCLQKLAQQYHEELRILTIIQDKDLETSRAAVDNAPLSWPVVCDSEPGGLMDQWGIKSFPAVFIIDVDGRIASLNANANANALVEEVVSDLVEKKSQNQTVNGSRQ